MDLRAPSVPPSVPPAVVAALRRTVAGRILYPADPAFDAHAADHPAARRPDVVVVATSEADVVAAARVAEAHGLRWTDPGPADVPSMLVLATRVDGVLVDPAARTATAGPGASWDDVAAAAARSGLAPLTRSDAPGSVAAAVLAGTAAATALRVVRPDGFAHLVDVPPTGVVPDGILTAVVVPLVVRTPSTPSMPSTPSTTETPRTTMTTTLPPLLLPGQAAAPPGPCDLTGMYVMHHGFRRDLARFDTAVARTPADDRPTWRALVERWARFSHELHEHHAKEDVGLWPVLLDRVGAEDRAVLEAMEEEHGLIDPLLAQVSAGLAAFAAGSASAVGPAERAALVDAVHTLRGTLDAHLSHEEVDAIRIIQAHVGAEEWAELEATVLRGRLSPRQMLFMLPWATDELPAEAVDRLFAGAPAPVRWFHALGRRAYVRLDRRAFVHA